METYSLPERISSVCFDIDKTLYTNDDYADSQVRVLMERLAVELSLTLPETERRVASEREKIRAAGQTASLGNTFARLGVPIETSVDWRTELIRPADYLSTDHRLRDALTALRESGIELAALTNNPVATGSATLEVLGVRDLILFVGGLDSTMQSKPSDAPFRWVLEKLPGDAGQMVFVGDRFGVDVEPALSLGAGGVLVSGVAEVYQLPGVLASRSSGVRK